MSKIKIVIIVVLSLLIIGLVAGVIVHSVKENEKNELTKNEVENNESNNQDFNFDIKETEAISLTASPIIVSDKGYVTQVLTATVVPASAEEKAVDWSVKWEDSTKTEDVTQYVKVEPQGDGSNVCNVNCYKGFDGKIIVTVTTRTGGYTANCVVTYVGKPSTLEIVPTNLTMTNGGYTIKPESSYSFELKQTSLLGDVKSGYTNYHITMKGTGSVIYSYCEAYRSGGFNWYDTSDEVVAYDTLLSKILTVKASGNYLEITTLEPIEEDCGTMTYLDSHRTKSWDDVFRSYVNDCYIDITVTETNTGLSDTIRVRLEQQEVVEKAY